MWFYASLDKYVHEFFIYDYKIQWPKFVPAIKNYTYMYKENKMKFATW